MFIKVKTPWGKEWLINKAEILAVEAESASIYLSGALSEGCNVLKVDADSLRRVSDVLC